MSFGTISGTDIQYGLISFDAGGKEMSEQGGLISQHLIDKARTDKITNVFFCHEWNGDVPAAKEQYSLWIKAFANSRDAEKDRDYFQNFRALFVGLHWPSLPFWRRRSWRRFIHNQRPSPLACRKAPRRHLKALDTKLQPKCVVLATSP